MKFRWRRERIDREYKDPELINIDCHGRRLKRCYQELRPPTRRIQHWPNSEMVLILKQ